MLTALFSKVSEQRLLFKTICKDMPKCFHFNKFHFQFNKCKILHLGRNSPRHQYMLGTTQLEQSLAEKDRTPRGRRASLEKHQGESYQRKKYLKRGCRDDGARLFLVVPSDRPRSTRHKLKPGRFCLNISKHFVTVRVTEH